MMEIYYSGFHRILDLLSLMVHVLAFLIVSSQQNYYYQNIKGLVGQHPIILDIDQLLLPILLDPNQFLFFVILVPNHIRLIVSLLSISVLFSLHLFDYFPPLINIYIYLYFYTSYHIYRFTFINDTQQELYLLWRTSILCLHVHLSFVVFQVLLTAPFFYQYVA